MALKKWILAYLLLFDRQLAPWQTWTAFRSCTTQTRVAARSNEHISAPIHPSLTLKCHISSVLSLFFADKVGLQDTVTRFPSSYCHFLHHSVYRPPWLSLSVSFSHFPSEINTHKSRQGYDLRNNPYLTVIFMTKPPRSSGLIDPGSPATL